MAQQSGQIVVRGADDLTVSVAEQQGVSRISQEEIDERIRVANGIGHKFFNGDFTFVLSVKPREPRITLVHSADMSITEDELLLNASLAYTVERAGVFELEINVPEGLEIDRVESARNEGLYGFRGRVAGHDYSDRAAFGSDFGIGRGSCRLPGWF